MTQAGGIDASNLERIMCVLTRKNVHGRRFSTEEEFNTAKRDLKHEIERLRRLDEGFADELTVFAGEENLDEDWDANTEHPNENPEILDSKIRVPVKSPNEDEQFVEVDALNYSREEAEILFKLRRAHFKKKKVLDEV